LGNGVYLYGSSSLSAPGLFVYEVHGIGLLVVDVATCSIAPVSTGPNVSACDGGGIYASLGSSITANDATTNGNAGGDFVAAHGSFIYAAGFRTPTAQFSPTRNTVGNGNSFIEG